jgi:hypothetical protein
MSEPPSAWYAYPEVGYPAKVRFGDSVYFDTVEKVVGAASVKLVTSRGWDVALNYRPASDSLAVWQLTDNDTLWFWVRTIKQPQYGFQYFSVRIGDDRGNYYKYTASTALLNAANLAWKQYRFPLSGNTQFARSMTGTMSLDKTSYVEIHADTWDYGFTLWVDGLQFHPCSPVTAVETAGTPAGTWLMNYPNPFRDATTVKYCLAEAGAVDLSVYDSRGMKVATLATGFQLRGEHRLEWNAQQPAMQGPGIYLLKLTTGSSVITRKILLTATSSRTRQ